jgi:Na+/H+ antiporter NhaC
MHPLVIGILAIFAVVASRVASIAAQEFLAMPAAGIAAGMGTLLLLVLVFAAIANLEAGKTLKKLSAVVGTHPLQRR